MPASATSRPAIGSASRSAGHLQSSPRRVPPRRNAEPRQQPSPDLLRHAGKADERHRARERESRTAGAAAAGCRSSVMNERDDGDDQERKRQHCASTPTTPALSGSSAARGRHVRRARAPAARPARRTGRGSRRASASSRAETPGSWAVPTNSSAGQRTRRRGQIRQSPNSPRRSPRALPRRCATTDPDEARRRRRSHPA